MPVVLSLSESSVFSVLRGFLLDVLPAGTPVVQGQINRVAEPEQDNFVVAWPLLRTRLSTNVVAVAEAQVQASIAGTVMTVTTIDSGQLFPGQSLAGDGIAPESGIVAVLSGTPGAQTYRVTPSQTVSAGLIFAGAKTTTAPTQLMVQLDVHGPISADNAQIISTMLRDTYACDFMAASSLPIQPLYSSDPRQIPFHNGEQQWENRWVVDAMLQFNPAVVIPQQFFAAVTVGLINVDARFPP